MKSTLLLLLLSFASTFAGAQSVILDINKENGSFKNFPLLPYNEVFSIRGEVDKAITMVEIEVYESKGHKNPTVYKWNRSMQNSSAFFDVIVTQGLKENTEYDFTIITYKGLARAEKEKLLTNLIVRVQHLLTDEIKAGKRSIEVDNPNKIIKGLNEILTSGISTQRSRNGISFDEVSKLVENELKKLDDFKLNQFIRRKKRTEKDSISVAMLENKVKYLTELVITEIAPFVNSELVQQYRKYDINHAKTEKDRFTLPINAGIYAWNTTADVSNVSTKNTGFTPGIGFTIPFARSLSIKGKPLPNIGFSMGVLTTPITNANGDKLVTPLVKLPIYAGLGVSFLRILRVNAAVTPVAIKGTTNITKLQWIPTVGISLEINAWLGVRR